PWLAQRRVLASATDAAHRAAAASATIRATNMKNCLLQLLLWRDPSDGPGVDQCRPVPCPPSAAACPTGRAGRHNSRHHRQAGRYEGVLKRGLAMNRRQLMMLAGGLPLMSTAHAQSM